MAALATQTVVRTGLTPTFAAATGGGDTMATGDTMFLVIKTAGTGCTVTIATPGTVEGQAIADVAVVVGATTEKWIGPITQSFFGDPATTPAYRALITYTQVTTVTVGALSL